MGREIDVDTWMDGQTGRQIERCTDEYRKVKKGRRK
jgi:hypothetical protein